MVKPVCFQIQTPTPTPYPLLFCFVFALTQAVDIVGGPARYLLLCSFRHMVESESSTHCLPVIMLVTQMLCRNDRETDTAATVQFQPLLLQQLCFHLTSSFILVQPLLLCFHHLSSLCYFVFIIYTGPAIVTLFSSFILVQPLFSSFILVQPLLLCFHHLYWSSLCFHHLYWSSHCFHHLYWSSHCFHHLYWSSLCYFVFIIYTGPAFVFIIYTGPAFVTLFSSFILVQPLFSSFILVQPLLLCFHHLYWSSLCFHHLYWSSHCFHHLYWSSHCFHHLYWSSLCYFVFIIYTGPAFVFIIYTGPAFVFIIYTGPAFVFIIYTGPAFVTLFSSFILVQPLLLWDFTCFHLTSSFILAGGFSSLLLTSLLVVDVFILFRKRVMSGNQHDFGFKFEDGYFTSFAFLHVLIMSSLIVEPAFSNLDGILILCQLHF